MKILKIKGYGNELGIKLEDPIVVSNNKKYEIALIGWFGTYSCENISQHKVYLDNKEITIRAGTYTVDMLNHAIMLPQEKQAVRNSPDNEKIGECMKKTVKGVPLTIVLPSCSATEALKDEEEGCTLNSASMKPLEEKDGFIEACFPVHATLGSLSEVLGFRRTKFFPNVMYRASKKHSLYKNNFNAVEIHCNICETSMQTYNENFRTHEGIEILYVCNPNLKEGQKFAEAPKPPMFIPLKEEFTKIKHIAVSIKNEKGVDLSLSNTYSNIYLALRETR